MTKRFLTHLSTIVLLHVIALISVWEPRSEYIRTQLTKVGTTALKLKIASSAPKSSPVSRKVTKSLPVTPSKPKTEKVPEQVVSKTDNTAGKATGSEVGTVANGKTDPLTVYKAELRAMIDKNKYYPTLSRRLGQTGTVVVSFTLLEDGNIIDVRIDKPSRYERLNISALDAVKKVERFKPIPKEVGEEKMDIKVPVKFFTI